MERILPGGSCLISSKDYPDAPNVPAPVPCPYCGANRYYLGMKLAGRIFWFPQPDDCDCPGAAAQRQQEQAIRESVTSLITAQLSQEGIPVQGIEVDVNMGEDGSIHMNQITVTLPAEYAGACFRASSILSSVLGLEAEVTADAGEQEAE